MGYPVKIATCCHCGSKAALRLDKRQHMLACASCGAPLRNFKALPVTAPARAGVSHRPPVRQFVQKPKAVAHKMAKPRKLKKRIGWLKDVAEDMFDFVEDIFD
jgi:hypothetical protein